MCKSQFPKECGTCGKVYPSFKSYVEGVSPIGLPKIDHIEDQDPLGLMSFGNCVCGSTLVIRCEDLGRDAEEKHKYFNEAIRQEEAEIGRPASAILLELRSWIRESVLRDE
jgi:hypothetical protein